MEFTLSTYSPFLETIPDAALVIQTDGAILLANAQAHQLLGAPPDGLIGQPICGFLPEAECAAFFQALAQVLTAPGEDSPASTLDSFARREDGSAFAANLTLRRLELGEGPHAVCILRDLSEVNRITERYRLISTMTSDYMFSTRVDADGSLTLNWVAGAFEAITGYTYDEYVAHGGWRGALHIEDLGQDDRDVARLRANRPVIDEVRTLHKDGQVVWVRVYAHPLWDAHSQRLAGIYGAVQDISERKRAEEIIEASEKRLSLIFNTVGDIIFLVAVEAENCFRFASVNPAFLTITGLQREQVVGKRVDEVLPQAALAVVLPKYQQAIRENKTVRWEEVTDYPMGTLVGEVAIIPYLDATGHCTHLVGSVHDITEIRRAEAEIHQLNAGLEQRVAQRTLQLQTANKELESFSYSVSHDLRAPLRAINGFAAIIARRHRASLSAEGQHYVDNIVQASERMGRLIDDLLTYSRIGRAGVRHEPIPLGAVLNSLVSDLETRLQPIGGTLQIDSPLPSVLGDKTVLYQIFSNLLENAITYRRPGVALKITVSADKDERAAIVRVVDNGIGIPREYYEKIFNIFQRLHSDEEYPGTGIGLATVKKSAEMLGGKVWVESTLGEGSTFFIELPRI